MTVVKIETKDNFNKLHNIIRKSKKGSIEVGFFADSPRYDSGVSVSNVAYWNEYGTKNIPERPFLRTSAQKNNEKYLGLVRSFLTAIFKGRATGKRAISTIALKVKNDIVDTIIRWTFPINAKSTEDKKGFNDPLVDTELMLESVDWRLSK